MASKRSGKVRSVSAASGRDAEREAQLWPALQPDAHAAVVFWNAFFGLRVGVQPLSIADVQRLIDLVRAICWVETKHGTFDGGASHGRMDVMQCADTRNPRWKELIARQPNSDRFVGGPGKGNWWADELASAAAADPAFDQAAALSRLNSVKAGSSDPGFTAKHSLYWGVPLLLHKMNGAAGAPSYQCGDLHRERLLAGARAYNGGGDPKYVAKVDAALTLFGGAPLTLNASSPDVAALLPAVNAAGHAPKPAVINKPSPNHASRQNNTIQYLILHNTDGSLKSALTRLTDPKQSVSAHYVVDRNGDIYQLVDDSEVAWHAGNKPINQQSIGVELVAWKEKRGMTAAQDASLVALARFVVEAYDIPLKNVLPHRRVRIGGTDCPGWVWPTDADLDAWVHANLA